MIRFFTILFVICGLMVNAQAVDHPPSAVAVAPAGKIAAVADAPFDFRQPKQVERDTDQANEQLTNGSGYDHTFVLNPNTIVRPGEIHQTRKIYQFSMSDSIGR